MNLELPWKFKPRSYQREPFVAWEGGVRRYGTVWHRRSGKDTTGLNFTICRMVERVGVYHHIFPTYSQAKDVLWLGMDGGTGRPFLEHFPDELVKRRNDTELFVELVNGSIYQLVGSDNYQLLRGQNPVGAIFSEYSEQTPDAWEQVYSPILAENGGWAWFNFTPKGRNHSYELYQKTRDNPLWFWSIKTIEDTRRDAPGENGEPVITAEYIEEERRQGRDEEVIQQEYYCSFSGYRTGSYYSKQMVELEREGRVVSVPWEPTLPVFTAWDLGVADHTAIWFGQHVGREVRLIDYLEEQGEGFLYYAKLLRQKPYYYSNHWAPHDIEVRELSSGRSRLEIARGLGINFRIVPNIPVADGIDNVRATLPRCWFDAQKCERGLKALINYHKQEQKGGGQYMPTPRHDVWSHGADAFRYFCLVVDRETDSYARPAERCETEFDLFPEIDNARGRE